MLRDDTVVAQSSLAEVDRLGIPVLDSALLQALVAEGQVRRFPRNTIVLLEGEPAEALYIVLEGRVRVYVSDEDGHEAELNQLGPHQYFGELMLGSRVRTASVRTMEPSKLCMIRRDDFERLIAARPELAFHLIQTLIHRVRVLTSNVQSLALMDVYGRVARLFLASAEEQDGRRVVPRMSQQQIAEKVGASRSMVNRILKDLSDGGFVRIDQGVIELLRPLPKRW